MYYKLIIRYYLDAHKVSSFYVEKIEDKLKHCCTDDEVYLRMSQLETKSGLIIASSEDLMILNLIGNLSLFYIIS